MRKSTAILENTIPLVEASKYGGRQRPTAVLLRTSWTTGVMGAANGIAQAWHSPSSGNDSCHYVVDEVQILRCVPDKVQAYHTSPEYKGAISINVCYEPPVCPRPLVAYNAALLTASLCKKYRIPVHIMSEDDEQRWLNHKWKSRGGIILKTEGNFSVEEFSLSVTLNYGRLNGGWNGLAN